MQAESEGLSDSAFYWNASSQAPENRIQVQKINISTEQPPEASLIQKTSTDYPLVAEQTSVNNGPSKPTNEANSNSEGNDITLVDLRNNKQDIETPQTQNFTQNKFEHNIQDYNTDEVLSGSNQGADKQASRSALNNRWKTQRNPGTGSAATLSAKHEKKPNPYISFMFKENEFLQASNAYHRLDKSQNFLENKAFAQTILNDLKQKKR